jgi:hypothetical protein
MSERRALSVERRNCSTLASPRSIRTCIAVLATTLLACHPGGDRFAAQGPRLPPLVRRPQLMADLRALADDSMEGRATGTRGSDRARAYLARELRRAGVRPIIGSSFVVPFTFAGRSDSAPRRGANVVGVIRGRTHPGRYIVVTAHYDHLGVQQGEIYHGADDNASGCSALLAAARYFSRHRPANSILLVAFDAEEIGKHGSRVFVEQPAVPKDSMMIDVNMDMVSRSDKGELYVVGPRFDPWLRSYVERIAHASPVTVRIGHEGPTLIPGDDWTGLSDQSAFHEAGIPILYFGVEDHPDYHKTTDVASRVQPAFFAGAVDTILALIQLLDENGERVRAKNGI